MKENNIIWFFFVFKKNKPKIKEFNSFEVYLFSQKQIKEIFSTK